MNAIDHARAARNTARQARDAGAAANAAMTLLDAHNAGFVSALDGRDEAILGELLQAWRTDLEACASELNDKSSNFFHARYFRMRGTLHDLAALRLYFAENNFIDAEHHFEISAAAHEQSAELIALVAARDDAPVEMKDLVAMFEAEALRVRGMKLLTKGEFETKIHSVESSLELLEQALDTLERAEIRMPRGSQTYLSATSPFDRAVNDLHFIDFTRALLNETLALDALMRLDLEDATRHETARAEALRRVEAAHARAGAPLHQEFARRLSREAFIASRRAEAFAREAAAQKAIRCEPYFGYPRADPHAPDIFVIMPFAQAHARVFEGPFKAAAKALGLVIQRGDDVFSSRVVMDDIWRSIASATVLIADCSGRNANVFYEIGVAHTLGKPVILTTRDVEDVPFDLRHIRFITYSADEAGMADLEQALIATLKAEPSIKDSIAEKQGQAP